LFESANHHGFLKPDNSEIDMKNSIAEMPKDHVSDEMSINGVVESLITLEATSTIQNVVALYDKLKMSYSANNVIEIDASCVSSIDTATLQLLVALKRDAIKEQKNVVFTAPSERFIEAAELLGLLEILNDEA
jgi:anti-anti-sigma regulatory factor